MHIYYALLKQETKYDTEYGYAYIYAESEERAIEVWGTYCGFEVEKIVLYGCDYGEIYEHRDICMMGFYDEQMEKPRALFETYQKLAEGKHEI